MTGDGYLMVYYKHQTMEKFPFSDMKLWMWSSMWSSMSPCEQHVSKDVLLILRENSRTEIPREAIEKVEVVYNTAEAMIKAAEEFANGEHDGPVHPDSS